MPNVDPTIEFVPIEIEGKTYQMCFDLEAMADAEDEINNAGGDICILEGLDVGRLRISQVKTLFACSLRMAQPDLPYSDARALVTWKTINVIRLHLLLAYCKSVGIEVDESEKKTEPSKEELTNENPESSSGADSGALPATI